mmetsp:Transcript_9704/g.14917  ORF Transcript_9704/g.14917 Transcript_9704/m.14917 type:complete len:191 (-) Transcript_9704:90-662(-)|eukprot:CAMPEP_0113938166 /NCGR_PEP_ID=MMETSP1339-20121228/4564_1 /TAXON_ID=94617 /ORGANISM="Fibrocapsa japonica" /LENGTH=190 /DNA_ID=CAMNT_0000941141 /DNA_START=84 /DNA_END=656 /DNA_ORIENTATION=+ /assembly_acc=CAM_ASM_000762
MRQIIIILLLALVAVSHAFSRNGITSRPMRLNKRFIVCSTASPDEDAMGKKLYDFAYRGNVEKLKTILDEAKGNKNILNWQSQERYGRTPLIIASYYNKIEAVKLLLGTKGVDVNMGTDFGATALHFAAHRGLLDMVKLLLSDRRTKVNVLATGGKWTGKSALDVCTGMGMSGKPEVIEFIIKKGGKPGK